MLDSTRNFLDTADLLPAGSLDQLKAHMVAQVPLEIAPRLLDRVIHNHHGLQVEVIPRYRDELLVRWNGKIARQDSPSSNSMRTRWQ